MNKKESIKPILIQYMVMRLSDKEILGHLKDHGYEITRQYLTKIKKEIQESRFDRLNLIAKSQFVDQHLERIDQLELINQEYWKLYRQEKNIFRKAQILEKIAELQTYISPYYSASRRIMEMSISNDNDNNTTDNKKRRKRKSETKEV
jgi:DNA repair ATPase RecN